MYLLHEKHTIFATNGTCFQFCESIHALNSEVNIELFDLSNFSSTLPNPCSFEKKSPQKNIHVSLIQRERLFNLKPLLLFLLGSTFFLFTLHATNLSNIKQPSNNTVGKLNILFEVFLFFTKLAVCLIICFYLLVPL